MTTASPYGTRKHGVAMLPLAIILALHLLLVLLWSTNARRQPQQDARQPHFTLIRLPALKPRVLPPQAPQRVTRATAISAAQPVPSKPVESPPHEETAQASAPDAPPLSQMLESAKRQAGAIDRDLRGGKPAPLAPDPNLPFTRFQRALESAYIDQSRVVLMDTITEPDGVIVYRFRRGGKEWCRKSGGGNPGMLERSEGAKLAGAGSGGGPDAAGFVKCPSAETARPLR